MARQYRLTPGAAGLARVLLATKDAHEIYVRCGFVPLARPGASWKLAT